MNLKEGSMLHNNTYKIIRVLGQGGAGITYLAMHTLLKKKIAIKEFFLGAYCTRDSATGYVSPTTESTREFVERQKQQFIKEAEHIAELDSPYIVKITDMFSENGTAYYIMDYIEGRSLTDIVTTQGPYSPEKAIEYIKKIGKALEYMHSKRMNHLDVKPANIMIRAKDDIPILVDFGLSKQYDADGNQTSASFLGKSPGYSPIEQYKDGGLIEFHPQTDLYSLAATLYFLLSGCVPPPAPQLIDEELSFPVIIPPKLIGPISKAMSVKRKERHDSVADFLREILEAGYNEETIIPKVISLGDISLGKKEDALQKNQHNTVVVKSGSEATKAKNSQKPTSYNLKKYLPTFGICIAILAVVCIIIYSLSHTDKGAKPDISEEVVVEEIFPIEDTEVVVVDEAVDDVIADSAAVW